MKGEVESEYDSEMQKLSTADRYLLARRTAKERMNLDYEITQADLADALGLSRYAIINIENGNTSNPKKSTHEKASKELRVNIEWLSNGRGPMDPELPDYQPPEVEKFGHKKTVVSGVSTSISNFAHTPVIVSESTADGKAWTCLIPEVNPEAPIETHIDPTLDTEHLSTLPIFRADLFITKSESDTVTAYVLKAYF